MIKNDRTSQKNGKSPGKNRPKTMKPQKKTENLREEFLPNFERAVPQSSNCRHFPRRCSCRSEFPRPFLERGRKCETCFCFYCNQEKPCPPRVAEAFFCGDLIEGQRTLQHSLSPYLFSCVFWLGEAGSS